MDLAIFQSSAEDHRVRCDRLRPHGLRRPTISYILKHRNTRISKHNSVDYDSSHIYDRSLGTKTDDITLLDNTKTVLY